MKNPLVLASGILGVNAALLKRVAVCGAGAVTMKSIGPKEKEGYANPTVIEWEHGLINAVGLPTPGIDNIASEFEGLKDCNAPIIASIYANSIEEYAMIAEKISAFNPAIIEINMSCPHSKGQGMPFGVDKTVAAEVITAVKRAAREIPIMPKLTPQAINIAEIASACEQAGANAICAINTLGPGMIIDIEARKPVLANKFGGVSGPAIKPIALKCVYNIFDAVKIPILGTGGITNGKDAIEMLMAGATACGIGSATYYRGIEAFSLIAKEMQEWMHSHKIENLKEIIGAAHK
jgi:dihydroorotate dehydrogenase (NAD+) catalytic subunit